MSTTLPCPNCKARGEQSALVAERAIVDSCPACGGVWCTAAVFEELVKQASEGRGDTAAALAKGASAAKQRGLARPIADADEQARAAPNYLPCPVCNRLIGRQNFAHRSGVKIHVCRQHGVWFKDEDQLEALVNWAQSGSLAAAREELEQQEARDERTRQRLIREGLDDQSALGRDWLLE